MTLAPPIPSPSPARGEGSRAGEDGATHNWINSLRCSPCGSQTAASPQFAAQSWVAPSGEAAD
jgi:hypothetical protein